MMNMASGRWKKESTRSSRGLGGSRLGSTLSKSWKLASSTATPSAKSASPGSTLSACSAKPPNELSMTVARAGGAPTATPLNQP